MTEGRRVRLSAEKRTEIWRRWKSGEALREIGRAFGKDHGSIQFLIATRRDRSGRSPPLAANAHASGLVQTGF